MSTAIVLLFVLASACGANASGDTGAEGPVSGAAAGDSGADGGAGVWRPRPGTSWQWQLSGPVDGGFDVVMYDIDLFDTPAATMAALRSAGRVVICYFSAGSHEDWRPDAARFPAEATGNRLEGWHGERWLDIRVDAVRALMVARLDLAVEKGCDGVEPDNVDGYANDSGFSLTPDDQLEFNRFLAAVAHARGLSVGLKNDNAQIPMLEGDFDWALNEECFRYDECDDLQSFIAAGKAVFQVEYGGADLAASVCPEANARNLDTLIKTPDLTASRIACR